MTRYILAILAAAIAAIYLTMWHVDRTDGQVLSGLADRQR